jgi:hypothetical protein
MPARVTGLAFRINLWMGLAMLALGLFFLVWQRLNPPEVPSAPATDDDRPSAH